MSDVFPRSNLPDEAVPWGRMIQEATVKNSRRLEDLRSAQASENRSQAGTLGVLGRQVEELRARETYSTDIPTLTLSRGGPSSTSVSFSFPSPSVRSRVAILTYSTTLRANSGFASDTRQRVWYDGSIIVGESTGALPSNTPVGWSPIVSKSVAVVVPFGVSPSFSLEFGAVFDSAGSVSLTGGFATLTYHGGIG